MSTNHEHEAWAVLWRSDNDLNGGYSQRFTGAFYARDQRMSGDTHPLFRTRQECREFIKKHYGYIARRPDLRREPHGWKMPIPVKVKVTIRLA